MVIKKISTIMSRQKITPHIWFDKEAVEAAGFYTRIFRNAEIRNETVLENTPSGSVEIVTLQLMGQEFIFISAGPMFKVNPSISFFVVLEDAGEIDSLWNSLKEGGMVMMDLQQYDWSEKYGWIQDRFGVSWQLSLGKMMDVGQWITPSLLFVGKQHGKAEEAVRFYTSVFEGSEITGILHYEKSENEPEGTVKHAQFSLGGEMFMAMDSSFDHQFGFNEAISLVVNCRNQEEIDYYWERLSADPSAEQCGWLKDRFGLSWQIVPVDLERMMQDGDGTKIKRVTEAFLKMKKFDLAALQNAYEGKEICGSREQIYGDFKK
jgi:predicted 3-demethylubiquinone-9 3-methyltransferase (glyoxalase superfamily)